MKHRTHPTHEKLPPHQPPGHHTVHSSLATLRNWREGSAATAIVMAALLPFAIAWHTTYLTAIATSLIAAAILAATCHITREHRVATLAVIPELTQLPEFAAKHTISRIATWVGVSSPVVIGSLLSGSFRV